MTSERYRVMAAIRDGRSYHRWPTMMRALWQLGWIRAIGPAPAPAEKRRRVQPVRPYAVTELGLEEMRKYEASRTTAEVPRPLLKGFEYGKDDPCGR